MSTAMSQAAGHRTPGPGRRPGNPVSTMGWAWSVVVADRRNLFRMSVMAVGIGLCAFVLLALATISPMIDSMDARAAVSTPQPTAAAGTFRFQRVQVTIDGHVVNGMLLQGTHAPPAPPGATRFPGNGELVVSPALARMLADPAAETARALLPGPVVGVLNADLLPGANDLFFYQGARDLPDPASADGWGVPPGEHPLDPRVWSLLITGAVLVMVPLLLFTALAGRLGSARRDRRSAVLRLVGASTRRLRYLVAGEALLAAALGVALAGGAYLLARLAVPTVRISGRGTQLTDVSPGFWWSAGILLGTPVLAVTAALVGYRAAAAGPLAVLGRDRRGPRAAWRVALVAAAVAVAAWAGFRRSINGGDSGVAVLAMCLLVALTLFAVAGLVGLVTDRLARMWRGGSVPGQLGRSRIVLDGSSTTRAAAALATVLTGFVVLMTLLAGSSYVSLQTESAGPTEFAGSVPSLTAPQWNRLQSSLAGTPGVQRAYLIGSLAGSLDVDRPQLTVASCAAIQAMTTASQCTEGDTFQVALTGQDLLPGAPFHLQFGDGRQATWSPPPTVIGVRETLQGNDNGYLTPTDYLLTPTAVEQQFPGALQHIGVQVTTTMPLAAVDAAQRSVAWLGSRGFGVLALSPVAALDGSPVPWIRAGLLACGLMTLVICALGQWLMGAEQLRERRRAFALARASGVPLSVLARSVLQAALLPVVVGICLAAVAGMFLAPFVEYLRDSIWVPPAWPWTLLGSAAALVVAVLVAGGSILVLRSTSGPDALRTE